MPTFLHWVVGGMYLLLPIFHTAFWKLLPYWIQMCFQRRVHLTMAAGTGKSTLSQNGCGKGECVLHAVTKGSAGLSSKRPMTTYVHDRPVCVNVKLHAQRKKRSWWDRKAVVKKSEHCGVYHDTGSSDTSQPRRGRRSDVRSVVLCTVYAADQITNKMVQLTCCLGFLLCL